MGLRTIFILFCYILCSFLLPRSILKVRFRSILLKSGASCGSEWRMKAPLILEGKEGPECISISGTALRSGELIAW